MIGMGEMFVRALTRELDPELIARDLTPTMNALAQASDPRSRSPPPGASSRAA